MTGTFLKLYESGQGNSAGYQLKILNPPEDTIPIKSDMFPAPISIFRHIKGECKRGDFVTSVRPEIENFL